MSTTSTFVYRFFLLFTAEEIDAGENGGRYARKVADKLAPGSFRYYRVRGALVYTKRVLPRCPLRARLYSPFFLYAPHRAFERLLSGSFPSPHRSYVGSLAYSRMHVKRLTEHRKKKISRVRDSIFSSSPQSRRSLHLFFSSTTPIHSFFSDLDTPSFFSPFPLRRFFFIFILFSLQFKLVHSFFPQASATISPIFSCRKASQKRSRSFPPINLPFYVELFTPEWEIRASLGHAQEFSIAIETYFFSAQSTISIISSTRDCCSETKFHLKN